MSTLVWDEIGERVYESGTDRGVLYVSDDVAVVWNGLTSVTEKINKEVSSIYYDGMKINELVSAGNYEAIMKAITYPDEFVELEGAVSLFPGMLLEDQPPKSFGLCYRTLIGNDVDGQYAGYKIHLVYNVIAIPKDKAFNTISNDASFSEFEWDIVAVPDEIFVARPTAHVIFNSITVDPPLLVAIEDLLYGTISTPPTLPSISDLITFITGFYGIAIIDNGDGTWTAYTANEDNIEFSGIDLDEFTIFNANATFLDPDTYEISDS